MSTTSHAGGLVTAQDAAEILGCSPQRVKQLVQEGRLAAPVEFGPRSHLYRRSHVEYVRDVLQGAALTPLSSLLPDAWNSPLRRTVDVVVPAPRSWSDETSLHIRVWEGMVDGAPRLVVLLAGPSGASVGHPDLTASWVDREVLGGRGRDAVWMLLIPREDRYTPPVLTNIVLGSRNSARSAKPSPFVRMFRREREEPLSDAWEPDQEQWHECDSVAELDRVVGEYVEHFPGETYTEANIEAWHRRRRSPIPVVDDPNELRPIADALHVVARMPASRPAAAALAGKVLARALRGRLAIDADPSRTTWIDRLERTAIDLDANHRAVAMTRCELTEGDQRVLDSFSTPVPDSESVSALAELRDWMESVDEYADEQDRDQSLCSALAQAVDFLERDARRAGIEVPVYPERIVFSHGVPGDFTRAYLDQVAWQPSSAKLTRRHRMLARQARGRAMFGEDLDGNLVAAWPSEEIPAGGRLSAVLSSKDRIAIEWPTVPTSSMLPPGSAIVADDEIGDLPVFVRFADGTLRLLPRRADRRHGGWNFGYGGGGPATLENAILHAFRVADGLADEQLIEVREFVDAQITHPGQRTLRILVDEIRKRVLPAE